MFQTNGFQSNGYQVAANQNKPSNAGDHVRPYDRYREKEYQDRIKREKSDLEKLESVIAENQRKAEIAAQNQKLASERRAKALARLEAEYLAEINRLLMVRADLIRRIREDEAILIIMMMKRRRLRVA